ncbi:MAG TPA: peptidoglycan DD-metalloendopeptidase family protein [Symbiobacteriaceae bacterium]|nr:peptidoglycan DD-metalloendopeptidase family protein [Symbiobacteriaceae bacterium]
MPRKPQLLLVVALLVLLGVAADLGWRAYTRPRYAVLVAGNLVGALRQPEVAEKALEAVFSQVPKELQAQVDLKSQIQVRPLSKEDNQPAVTDSPMIEQALVKTIPSLAYATAITVDGQDIVAVNDVEAARTVRETILAEYKTAVLGDSSDVEQLAFQEKIDWHPKVVPTERVRTVEEAINILKHGTDKLATYIVKSGDTGWDIARSYNVTTDQLAKANPEVDLESLQIDQALNVTFREPYVHTQSVSKRVVKEGIPFTERTVKDPDLWPWQYVVLTPGAPGVRELTIREYRENGRVVKTEVLENEVLQQPKQQVARTGTKQVPALGTGTLVFPVVGELTSPFAPRWGSFHYGIDLAASEGTPVLAADSGMVVFRGWDGNYGYVLHVDHGGGEMVTWYAHLSGFAVSQGETVTKGQVIGYVGNTGFSTGPHLHYEVHVNGTAVNPLEFYQ